MSGTPTRLHLARVEPRINPGRCTHCNPIAPGTQIPGPNPDHEWVDPRPAAARPRARVDWTHLPCGRVFGLAFASIERRAAEIGVAMPVAAHYIEDAARVWLRLNPAGDGWELDSFKADESFLSDYRDYDERPPSNEECPCDDEEACEREVARVDKEVGMPTPRELLDILADALGYRLQPKG